MLNPPCSATNANNLVRYNDCELTLGSGKNAEKGCFTKRGVCSKDDVQSALFDNIHAGAFHLAIHARPILDLQGAIPKSWTLALVNAFFLTLTNVNFDHSRVAKHINDIYVCSEEAKQMLKQLNLEPFEYPAEFGIANKLSLKSWVPAKTTGELEQQGRQFGIFQRLKTQGATVTGLQEISIYGLKGLSAYASHVDILGGDISNDGKAIVTVLTEMLKPNADLLALAMEVGRMNLDTMERLDPANTSAYGTPTLTRVNFGVRNGKCLLMSGHDLHDLHSILKATEGSGVNVYTHGEMLISNAYPELRKFSHLVGNFGSAWQNQRKEFSLFPGSIVLNTNCIMPPRETYKDRMFTCNLVGVEGVPHIDYLPDNYPEKDWTPVIKKAQDMPGFASDGPPLFEGFLPDQIIGANWRTTTALSDAIIELVKAGKLRRVFFVGGCDGSFPGRNYFSEVAEYVNKNLPDCIVIGSAYDILI
ncbi:hypothetical protein GEMRC1_007831 [Eukaryota sp. GEM-RC1]